MICLGIIIVMMATDPYHQQAYSQLLLVKCQMPMEDQYVANQSDSQTKIEPRPVGAAEGTYVKMWLDKDHSLSVRRWWEHEQWKKHHEPSKFIIHTGAYLVSMGSTTILWEELQHSHKINGIFASSLSSTVPGGGVGFSSIKKGKEREKKALGRIRAPNVFWRHSLSRTEFKKISSFYDACQTTGSDGDDDALNLPTFSSLKGGLKGLKITYRLRSSCLIAPSIGMIGARIRTQLEKNVGTPISLDLE